jgi:hypothetical protein
MAKKRQVKDARYILRRAKNGRRREKHVSAAVYGVDKLRLQREANDYAQAHLGYAKMSVSAYINIKLLLP